MAADERPTLIIAGAPKCGTSSLFAWLAAHPDVAPCRVKEPGFFMDRGAATEAPVAGLLDAGAPMAAYDALFPAAGRVRLEATVGYLFSPGTPARLRAALPGARPLFVLRHPVDRLVSAWRFLGSLHGPAAGQSFGAFLDAQTARLDDPRRRQAAEGRYAALLGPWIEAWGQEGVLLLPFADLAEDPPGTCARACAFAGLDPAPLAGARHERRNATQGYRSARIDRAWRAVMEGAHRHAVRHPTLYRALHAVNRRTLMPLYARINRHAAPPAAIPPEELARAEAFYAGEAEALERLTGRADLLRRPAARTG